MLGNMEKADYSEVNVSKNGVVYFPFNEEKETIDWIDDMIGQWWDGEYIGHIEDKYIDEIENALLKFIGIE